MVTDRAFYKKVMVILIPVVLQSMINQGVNMMDTIMVGQLGAALGILVGLVWQMDPFWVLLALRVDFFIKSVWLVFRLKGDKWIHKAKKMEG